MGRGITKLSPEKLPAGLARWVQAAQHRLMETIHLSERLSGMVWGQLVADSAAMGSHWIYNLTELARQFPEGVHGFEAPPEGHHHAGKQPGDFTHYGDAAMIALESVAACGRLEVRDYAARFFDRMRPGTYTGYVDHATRGTFENLRALGDTPLDRIADYRLGADDDQLATATSLAPVIAAHWQAEDLDERIEAATRLRQNNDRAVSYMIAHGAILVELLHGRDIHSALHRVEEGIAGRAALGAEVKRKIGDAFGALEKSVTQATDAFGQSCPLISSFPSAVHAFIKHGESFEDMVLAILRAGGDNAGRAAMAGAWAGAHLGLDAIPLEWRQRLRRKEDIDRLVRQLVGG